MNGGFGRAALAGMGLAVVSLVAVGVLLVSGRIDLPRRDVPVTDLVVIATAPDEAGGEIAALAIRVDTATGSRVTILDTVSAAPLAGTSARNAREAYPFGGGSAVAQSLSPQTGGEPLPWIVLPAETWADMIDDGGGIETSIERGISVYLEGELTVVEPGVQTLSGDEAVALASGIAYVGEPQRSVLVDVLGGALATALTDERASLRRLVASGKAKSDVEPDLLPGGE